VQEPKATPTPIAQLAAASWLPGKPNSLCFLAAAGRPNSFRSCSQPLGHILWRPGVGTCGVKALQPFDVTKIGQESAVSGRGRTGS